MSNNKRSSHTSQQRTFRHLRRLKMYNIIPIYIYIYLSGTQGKKKRDFVQSFFLAVQEKGYFVLNDTFRYLSVNHSRQSQVPKENGYHQAPYDKPYLQVDNQSVSICQYIDDSAELVNLPLATCCDTVSYPSPILLPSL